MSLRAMRSSRWLGKLRRWAGAAKRSVLPSDEVVAWRYACRLAERTPRFTKGRVRLLDYELDYVDLLTLCPQWHDIFVRETLRVSMGADEPRVLDCGANIGLASLYIRSRYPSASVTAFEADPDIAAVLEGNLARNGCANVEVVNAAVWTKTGSVSFRCEGADSGAVGELALGLSAPERPVPSVRLRDYLSREPVDLLKLDIEGAERVVLDDCADVLGNVRAIVMELHEFDVAHRCTMAVLERLEASGFLWSLDELVPFGWRPPVASTESPFPGTHLCWGVLVRAWQPKATSG